MNHVITTFEQLHCACKEDNKTIYETALDYEASQGENSEYKVRLQAKKSLDAMKEAIKAGVLNEQVNATPKILNKTPMIIIT